MLTVFIADLISYFRDGKLHKYLFVGNNLHKTHLQSIKIYYRIRL